MTARTARTTSTSARWTETTLIAITGAAGVKGRRGHRHQLQRSATRCWRHPGSVVNNKGGSVSVTAEDNSALGGGAVGRRREGEAMFAGTGSIQVNRVHSAVAAYVLPR